MSAVKYSVVMPAYLEEENLRLLLPRLQETMEERTNFTKSLSLILPVPWMPPCRV